MDKFVEPGAVRHGNFINYYDFNSAPERLNLLPIDDCFWKTSSKQPNDPYLVLDVGCNAGNFTQLLYDFLVQKMPNRPVVILGVDIDPILIERALESNQHKQNVHYSCFDMMEFKSDHNCIADHLKLYERTTFDVVCCFSITMWIHLNNGDDGLGRFLDIVSKLSTFLIIEPQPWKCYQNAVRRMKRAGSCDTFPLYATLKIRNDVENHIKDYLRTSKQLEMIFESDPTKWKRRICFYRRLD